MMKTTTDTGAGSVADHVAGEVEELLTRLYSEDGIPVETVMAAAHGQMVAMLAECFGGTVAAERCLSAANLVKDLPSLVDLMLLAAEPEGHA